MLMMIYFIIGMIHAGLWMSKVMKEVNESDKPEKEKVAIVVTGLFICIILGVPLWPLFLAMALGKKVLK